MDTTTLTVPPEAAGERLDRFLSTALPGLSRSRLKALIEAGHVRLDAATIGDPNRRVKPGQALSVALPPPAPAEPAAQAIALQVVFEDRHLIVIDKPAGLVVHPAPGNQDGTLVNALIAHCGDSLSGIGGVRRPGIVHRIDKDTSGLLVAAKTDAAHQHLSAQFQAHSIEREYLALVRGVPVPLAGTISGPIGRDPRHRQRMAILASGKPAVTHYRTLSRFGEAASLLACRLETGRTHQIRVHLASRGHPLAGDPLYGGRRKASGVAGLDAVLNAFQRQALHAARLGFSHPQTAEWLAFESPLPADMAGLIEAVAVLFRS